MSVNVKGTFVPHEVFRKRKLGLWMGLVGAQGHTEEESDFSCVHFKPTSDTTPGPMASPD